MVDNIGFIFVKAPNVLRIATAYLVNATNSVASCNWAQALLETMVVSLSMVLAISTNGTES